MYYFLYFNSESYIYNYNLFKDQEVHIENIT